MCNIKQFFIFFLFSTVFGTLSAWEDFTQHSIADELKKPGVKLVAVDFYTTGCPACDDAIPKWKKLQTEYGDKGFKLIVVSVLSEGKCSQPEQQWIPDKKVCDTDGKIAEAWHVKIYPDVFLWSWDGNLLVSHGNVDDVAAATKNYFDKEPRILIEEKTDKNIYQLIRSELRKNSKFEILSSEEEQKELERIRKESNNKPIYDKNLGCKLGMQISANSLLKISKTQKQLLLDLLSAEKGCFMANGSAEIRGNIETEVAKAVDNLLENLLGSVAMPEKRKDIVKDSTFGSSSPKDSRMPESEEKTIVDKKKPRLAVMEIEDETGIFDQKSLSGATEYLRGQLVGSNKFTVVAKDHQERVKEELKNEFKGECYDYKCRTALGRNLYADTILINKIYSVGKNHVMINSSLINLKTDTAIKVAQETFAIEKEKAESLLPVLRNIVDQITDKKISKLEKSDFFGDYNMTTYQKVNAIWGTIGSGLGLILIGFPTLGVGLWQDFEVDQYGSEAKADKAKNAHIISGAVLFGSGIALLVPGITYAVYDTYTKEIGRAHV